MRTYLSAWLILFVTFGLVAWLSPNHGGVPEFFGIFTLLKINVLVAGCFIALLID